MLASGRWDLIRRLKGYNIYVSAPQSVADQLRMFCGNPVGNQALNSRHRGRKKFIEVMSLQ
jgi:hypothetical protein